MSVVITRFLILFILLIFSNLNSLSVGSPSACSIQEHITFPENDSDNEMNGFAFFKNGFTLESARTTCTFDSFYPISSEVDLRCGSLYLQKDLIFDSQATLTNMGNIYGNGFKTEFSENINTFTTFGLKNDNYVFEEVDDYNLNYDVNSVDWTYDDEYVVTVEEENYLEVFGFDGSSLSVVDYITVYNTPNVVRAHPSGYYFAVGTVYVSGYYNIRIYKLVGSVLSHVGAGASQVIYDEDILSLDWSDDGGYLVVGSNSTSLGYGYVAVYSFASETLTEEDKISLPAGEEATSRAICWDQTGNYFSLGTESASASRLRIYNFNGSAITAKTTVNNGSVPVLAVDWSKTDSFISFGDQGSSNQLRVYEYNSSTDSLTERESISIGGYCRSVHWNNDATMLAVGRSSGTGTEFRIYDFDQGTYELTLNQEDGLNNTNVNSVRWSYDNNYLACGDDNNYVTVFEHGEEPGYFVNFVVLDNVNIILNSNLSWKMATTVQNECIINGRDHEIMLEEDGVISVTTGASLKIKNAKLSGLTSQNFKCISDDSSIELENCDINLTVDFEFSKGSLLLSGENVFTGTNMFTYSSEMTSTISTKTKLIVNKYASFKYSPPTNNRDLLYMWDATSCLYLDGCSLISTSTGLRLTKGKLIVDNDVTFSCEGTEYSESICFGDGASSDNDLDIKILSGADISVYGGLCYDNVG